MNFGMEKINPRGRKSMNRFPPRTLLCEIRVTLEKGTVLKDP
jgi:hypothetical protein